MFHLDKSTKGWDFTIRHVDGLPAFPTQDYMILEGVVIHVLLCEVTHNVQLKWNSENLLSTRSSPYESYNKKNERLQEK